MGHLKKRGKKLKLKNLIFAQTLSIILNFFIQIKKPEYTCLCNYRLPTGINPPLDLSSFPSLISDPKIFSSSDHRKNQPASKQKRKLISASNISPEGFDLSGLDKKYPAPTITSINNPRHHKSGQITTEHQDRSKRFKQKNLNDFFNSH